MSTQPIKVGLVGAGRIGRNHAEILARHTPSAELVAVADPNRAAAEDLAAALDVPIVCESMDELLTQDIQAVTIAAPSFLHGQLIRQAAAAGKAIFCEKPASMDLDELDAALGAVEQAGVVFQVGFNRRFAAGFAATRSAIDEGRLGVVQLLRSNTRDPELADPAGPPPFTIFTQTLIHDFDTLNWLNPGANPVRVYAQADALIAPDFKNKGLLDTALVTIAYSNGALAMADASFQAVYGYDVRGEVFGSGGLATAGHASVTDMTYYGATGIQIATSRSDTDLLQDSYRAEFAAFIEAVRSGEVTGATGHDARRALAVAMAAIESYTTGLPVEL